MKHLGETLRKRVLADTIIRQVRIGEFVCRKGDSVEHWIGILDGLVKLASVSSEGKSISFAGIPSGGWFGEGSLLKREPARYDAISLRTSTIAFVPKRTFALLLDCSDAFNRFLILYLNERLEYFIGMVEYDRSLRPEARLAKELAALFNPFLYPHSGRTLSVSQEELAHLVGLSRQRVNRALGQLELAGLLRLGYRDITVLDRKALMRFEKES